MVTIPCTMVDWRVLDLCISICLQQMHHH